MSETTTTRKAVKKALMGATLLATSPAWAKGGGGDAAGGKSQLGVNHLSLDITPGVNATVCTSPEDVGSKTGSNFTANDIDIAVNPFASSVIEITFSVRDIIAHNRDHVLILVTNSQITPPGSPSIPTPQSLNELRIAVTGLEFLAMLDIPAQSMLSQDTTRLGMANPAPHSTVAFNVNLDATVLPQYMSNSEKTYVQAALIPAEDLAAGRFDTMILSELDTIGFVEMSCPAGDASMAVDDSGTLTVTDSGGDILKTTVTASAEASATTISVGKD